MRGHCTHKAPESFSDRHDAPSELVEACLSIAAAHNVLQLLPLGVALSCLNLRISLETGHVSDQNIVPFVIPNCTVNSMKTTPNLFLSQYKDIKRETLNFTVHKVWDFNNSVTYVGSGGFIIAENF